MSSRAPTIAICAWLDFLLPHRFARPAIGHFPLHPFLAFAFNFAFFFPVAFAHKHGTATRLAQKNTGTDMSIQCDGQVPLRGCLYCLPAPPEA